jgi:phosphatidylglycerol:prolipoprotein diacylglycerol transferase
VTTVYPFTIRIGTFEITGYGLMVMVGFLVGGWLIDRELRRRGLNPDYAADITVAAVIGGIIGAKLWYVALTRDPGALLSRGGLVWYGGFLGGALAVVVNGHRRGVPIRWTAHLVAPALAAAYALGRLGCFMVGDDYGMPTEVPWSVKFPQGLPPTTAGALRGLGAAVPADLDPTTVLAVHPTQLYEAAVMTAVFMVLWRLRTAAKGTGWLFGVYLTMAGIERFAVEFLRAKDDRFLAGFTLAQLTSVILALIGAYVVMRLSNAGEVAPGAYLRADGRTGGQAGGDRRAGGDSRAGGRAGGK